LTTSLDVSSFLLALCRFSARRGLPATLISDNAKSFKAASKEVSHYLTNNRIFWNFIAEKVPWWDGFWERMVRGVKKEMRNSEHYLLKLNLWSMLDPLLMFMMTQKELTYALTPSHLIYGRRITT